VIANNNRTVAHLKNRTGMVIAILDQIKEDNWRLFTGSTNRPILGTAVVVAGATAFVSLASIDREFLVAATFARATPLRRF
jgi:hypothetical protein